MCSIFQQVEGYTLPFELLFNAVHNNEHGWGILFKDNKTKKIEVKKGLPDKVDPQAIYQMLKDNEDVERWVHLRNCSQGEITLDNVQPIPVFHSAKKDVFFMHNGTIYSISVPDDQKAHLDLDLTDTRISDSVKFAKAKIAPILSRFKGENGAADIRDPFLIENLGNKWHHGHGRGVLIANDQDSTFFNKGQWETIKDGSGGEFLASNNDYFKELKRGTLFNERKAKEEAAKRKKEEKERANSPQISSENLPYANKMGGITVLQYPPFLKQQSLTEETLNLIDEVDVFTPEGFAMLSWMDHVEAKSLLTNNPEDGAYLFLTLVNYLKDMVDALERTNQKNDNATKLIASMKEQEKLKNYVHIG